ncbi:D-Ala-D-Ala carboxypeptidase family metallohydrolase [Leptolyngbya sp. O-77]|uniref:D-Ala-D-Ala carboxypeptidase family metallohydrolase n=1 Tax=Leptolyngbya sp. O-77 TaxID=1080068 RepID=UPI00074D3331|nr:D-Ala-D-Ala carboxypeptidase family metallohydrolase [Leptolyngbya sp. O-77]BAU41967.1 Peptidase M15 [Leptolyngbya sp. O-77]
MTKQIIKITDSRAVLKRRPFTSGHLPPNEQFKVEAGAEYEIQSYAYADSAGDFDEHIKFALKEGNLGGFNTWYIYNRFAEVVADGEVVYPIEEQTAAQILEITQDTVIKRRPVPVEELTEEEIFKVPKGMTFDLHSYAYADPSGTLKGQIRFAINNPEQYIRGISLWHVSDQHAQVKFDDKVVYPIPVAAPAVAMATAAAAPTAAPKTFSGKEIKLVGNRGTVYSDQPIIPNGSFTWGEATHNCTRLPQTAEHVENMVRLATQLEKARQQIGKPFRITSWYRPEPFNSKAGGARRSQHLGGGAVDIVVQGYMGADLAKMLVGWWPGGLGIYAGNRRHILHLDVGVKRKWGF